jgi:predicted CopG family antitoxin
MATKTISLELDAYEKLRRAKTGDRESFSEVVRRAVFPASPHTGAAVLEELEDLGEVASEEVLRYLDAAREEDRDRPRVSGSCWELGDAS